MMTLLLEGLLKGLVIGLMIGFVIGFMWALFGKYYFKKIKQLKEGKEE